jgi:diketogulonate reductase-like aldo/keto reductase
VAYSPFGAGDFPSPRSPGGKVLEEVARAHRATARQVALRFLVRRPSVVTIPKHSKVAHAEDNAGAASLELAAEDLARIEQAFPIRRRRGLPTL